MAVWWGDDPHLPQICGIKISVTSIPVWSVPRMWTDRTADYASSGFTLWEWSGSLELKRWIFSRRKSFSCTCFRAGRDEKDRISSGRCLVWLWDKETISGQTVLYGRRTAWYLSDVRKRGRHDPNLWTGTVRRWKAVWYLENARVSGQWNLSALSG